MNLTSINSFGEIFEGTVLIGHVDASGRLTSSDGSALVLDPHDLRKVRDWERVYEAANETVEYRATTGQKYCFLTYYGNGRLYVYWGAWHDARDAAYWKDMNDLARRWNGVVDILSDEANADMACIMRQATIYFPCESLPVHGPHSGRYPPPPSWSLSNGPHRALVEPHH